MISDATLKEVSHIFCGDVEGYFCYKSGPKLVNFSMNTKVLLRSYKSEALDTTVILYGVDWSESRLIAVLDYKDVHCSFIKDNVSEAEMMEFIETLR